MVIKVSNCEIGSLIEKLSFSVRGLNTPPFRGIIAAFGMADIYIESAVVRHFIFPSE
jgi:hypothetical protein